MGEAKRRREAQKQPIVARNMATGEWIEIRRAGDPLALREGFRAVLEGRDEVARVPCGGCRVCCYHRGVDVHPELESAESLAHLDLEKRADGDLYLRKREDGACVHLGPKGCTVYQHRPHACRTYDCRLYSLFSLRDSFDDGRVQPIWVFQPTTREGRVFEATCKAMAAVESKKLRDSDKRASVNDVVGAVMASPMFDGVASTIDALSRLPLDELAKVLGVDPRSLSRGIHIPPPPTLRFHSVLTDQCSTAGRAWPALVCLITDSRSGLPLGVYAVYLSSDGASLAPVPSPTAIVGVCDGGVVRLAEPGGERADVLMVGVGLLTCLGVMQDSGDAVWAALSEKDLVELDLPPGQHGVIVLSGCCDAAQAAAWRLKQQGRRVAIVAPLREVEICGCPRPRPHPVTDVVH
jgi:Putative zinc- or iron-chelating domain